MVHYQITADRGCSSVDATATVTINALPTPSITATETSGTTNNDGILCTGASATLNGGTFASYSWTGGATTQTINVNTAGIYTVTVTDANGCVNNATKQVTVNPLPVPNATATNVACKGLNTGMATSVPGGATSPYSFLWNTGAVTSTASNLFAGAYTVTVTDANACVQTAAVNITQPATVLTISIVKTNVRCGGKATGSITAMPTGGGGIYTGYEWTGGGTTATISNLYAGNYTVTVTDNIGCAKAKSTTITQNATMVLSVLPGPLSGEATASVLSGGVSPFSYLWNTTPVQQSTATATGLAAGTYKAKVTDSKGCTAMGTAVVPKLAAANDGNALNIALYPNPTDGIVNIDIENNTGTNSVVRIYNALGELIMTRVISSQITLTQIDLTSYGSSIYSVTVMAGDSVKTVKLFFEK